MSLGYHPDLDVALDRALLDSTSSAAPAIAPPRVPASSAARPVGVADLSLVPTRRLQDEMRALRRELQRRERIRHRMDHADTTPNDGSTP